MLDNFIPLHGRINHAQYAGWEPTRFADSGLGCHLESDVGIPMADGTLLSADVYRPRKSGRYPVIVQVSAYNKELHASGLPKGTNEVGSPPVITDRGYVQVLASRRGMGRSQGHSGGFAGEQEIDDYVRAVEWAAEQPWSNGDVCLFGTSYYALIQPLVALRRPAPLRAMFANEICTDFFRHLVNYGGSVNNRFLALWLGANFKDSDFATTVEPWKRALASQFVNRSWIWDKVVHPRVDEIYEGLMTKRPSRDMRDWFAHTIAESKSRETMPFAPGPFRELERITTPFVVVHNRAQWNIHQFGAFDLYERAGTPADRKYLIVGEREYELPVLSWQLEALAFFDHVVKGCDNGYGDQAHVRYWVDGADRYEGATHFPPPVAKRTRLYLGGVSTPARQPRSRCRRACPTAARTAGPPCPRARPCPTASTR
jgi:putative CocE/NonD family hydrolase